MKVFISQPMRGKTEEEILKVREELIEYAKAKYGSSVEIINSFLDEITHPDFCSKYEELPHPLVLLGESIKLLAEADVAIFAPDWTDARGCHVEHHCCREYKIQIDYYSNPSKLAEPSFVSDYY